MCLACSSRCGCAAEPPIAFTLDGPATRVDGANEGLMPIDLTARPDTDPIGAYRYRDGLYGVDLLIATVTHLNLFTWLAAHPSTKEQICAHYGFADRPVDVL